MGNQPKVIVAMVLYEPGDQPLDRTTDFVKSALKAALRNIRGTGAGAVVLFDEQGNFIGSDISGTQASAELKDEVARLAKEGPSPPIPNVPPLAG